MNKLPPFLRDDTKAHSICLILEGYEEDYYFKKLKEFRIFSKSYNIKLVNAKTENNIPAKYQEAYSSDSYEIVLVVCDKDREPTEYEKVVQKIDEVLGEGKAEKIITFTRPCILQVVLSHFGDVRLKTQAKKAAQPDVEKLTGVKGYDAHKNQLEVICGKIHFRTYEDMKRRVEEIGDDASQIPSSNILRLLGWLESEIPKWIEEVNNDINR